MIYPTPRITTQKKKSKSSSLFNCVRATLLALLCIPLSASYAQDVDEQLSILSKWIETKKENAALRSKWLVEKEDLVHEETLLESEAKSLSNQLETLRNLKASLLEEKQDALSLQAEQELQINELEQALTKYTAALNSLLPQLPPPLAETVNGLLAEIPGRNNGLGARYQRLINAIGEVHSFSNQTLHLVEIREDASGKNRQMDTLYWGLTLAYSVDQTGSVAQTGYNTGTDWKWKDASEHASAIRKLLDTQDGTVPPTYVTSPVSQHD